MRGLQTPFSRHFLQKESTRNNRASILSLKALSFRLGFVLTGPVIGYAADHYGLNMTFLALTFVFVPLYLLLARNFRHQNLLLA